jgi:uncharacterized protein (TIGR03435 family)
MRFAISSLLLAAALLAQERAFDVASIKRNRTGAVGSDTNTTPGRVTLVNVTLMSVVLRAFGVLNQQVIGAPDWLSTERYDIVATTADATALTDDVRQAYFQGLLADRCRFRFHRETRAIRVYSLVPSKEGFKLIAHTGPGEYAMRVQPTDDGRLRLRSTRGNMKRLAEILAGQTGDLVADRTGLSGEYDFTLEWVPDVNTGAPGSSVFTALTEQLGLKLDSAKTPIPVVVIERIERPTED